MRQTTLAEFTKRTNGRITRGFSDLPKEEEQPERSELSESEEESNSQQPQKTKKIHHMTLKAMERRKKEIEIAEARAKGIEIEDLPELTKPRRRGRPKGSGKRVEDKDSFQAEEGLSEEIDTDKKPVSLRERSKKRKIIVDEDSKQIEEEIQREIEKKEKAKQAKEAEAVVQTGPKKRGRKKKILPQIQIEPKQVDLAPSPPPIPLKKIYTVPKVQTYDNYNKYYDKILEQTRERKGLQIPLIFDKFSQPEAYNKLVKLIK